MRQDLWALQRSSEGPLDGTSWWGADGMSYPLRLNSVA